MMRPSAIGQPWSTLDTPALLLDLDRFEHNVGVMAGHLARHSVQWRPHAKAFKCPAIAHVLKKAGAIGVTVAKVSEAEVMVAGGIDDVLIAHLVVGPSKAARLAALQRRGDVKVTVDNPDHIGPLGQAAREAGVSIGVVVDVDLGMKRCGVSSPEGAASLAQKVEQTEGLRFDGLMGYEGHTLLIPDPQAKRLAITQAIDRLIQARDAVSKAGLPCRIVSAGGSGSYQITAGLPGVTELQAGGGIFACQYYTRLCQIEGHQPAIFVLATVVSRPAPDRAILDIGHKSISDHRTPPILPGLPNSRILSLSAEHANVELGDGDRPSIGEKLAVIPGYSDFTFVLHDRVPGIRQDRVESVWELYGRGMLQ
jgi:D-serine deaminase-like pyridoxal phosphate-dependent protein